jgi:hypothetical protein
MVKDARNIVVYALVAVFLVMLLVYLMPKYCGVSMVEGFQTQAEDECAPSKSTGVTSCPAGSKAYTDSKGNVNCCSGIVNGTMCDGNIVCTFSSSGNSGYPVCGTNRNRKYTGRVDFVVKKYMATDARQKFSKAITELQNFLPKMIELKKSQQISDDTLSAYKQLIKEEEEWLRTNKTEKAPRLYQEEMMYVMTKVESMLADQPILQKQNHPVLVNEILDTICPKTECPACPDCPECPPAPECPKATCPEQPKYVQIKSGMPQKKCLDLFWDWKDNSPLVINTCSGITNQNFYFDDKDRIIVEFTKKCLEVDNRNKNAGNAIGQSTCNDNQSQKWKRDDQNRIVSLFSGKCMDLPYGKEDNGNGIKVYDCHNEANQKWFT